MKAIVYTKYGPPEVLRLQEVEKPAPRDNEVLVQVHATTVTIGDTIMRSLSMPIPGWQRLLARIYLGVRKPKRPILGMELAGEVESVGEKVSLIPLSEQVDGVVTQGLIYPLRNEPLFLGRARGVSNVLVGDHAEISFTRGLLLIVHLFGAA
jgi:NADPH:quinone reductase-like Zn-dependent oxidoreductase